MPKLETALFLGALAALASGVPAHLDDDLGDLAERMLRRWRPRARA